MASTFIANSYQVNFDSVLLISDHDGMLNMFKALEASGWRGFMGCESVVYEKELEQFFDTTLVQDGDITGAVSGKLFSISQARFAETFELPTDGLVLEETSFLATDETEQGKQHFDETEIGDDFDQWLEESLKDFASRENEPVVGSTSELVKQTGTEERVADEQTLEIVDEIGTVTAAVGSKQSAEEHMSIDDLLLQISNDMMLPSVTAVKITKIRLGESININEVQERDWYYASLPRISTHDKGKEPLEENEPVRGNPAKEIVELICGDVDFLVQLRDKKYYIPGQPWTATASQIIDLLSDSHSKSFEELLIQQQEHGFVMVQPSSSLSIVDSGVGGGDVLAHFYSMAKSTCWVRPMILVNGVWTPIQGNDFWRSSCRLSLFVNRRRVPESVVDTDFVPHGLFIEPVQYWGAAPSLIKTWGWDRVCTEIVRYSMFGCLRPVRKDVCRDIVVYSLAVERIPTSFHRIFQQGVYTDSYVGYFSDSDVQCLPEFDSTSSDGSTVYRSPSPQVESFEEAESVEPIAHLALGPAISGVAQEEQSFFVESPESPPITFQRQDTSASSSDSPMHFNSDDIPLDDTAYVQPTFPAVNVDLSPLLDDLKFLYHSKVVLAQGVTAGADSVEVRKELKALDAKINSLDGQVAAIRNEHLEFQTKIAADILNLSTQLGDLVEYIRGGDAKKGEGRSSSRPLPPPVNQGEGNGGDTVRTTEIAQRDIDNAQRNILERLMAADRQRERERSIRSRSGSHTRRRY
ncbi:nuclear matrix constituent protein 1-like protein-like [Dorcoceras hygrometricum]|uniref:Nuclear matrix constituent protein 1-like protein-like n=1 Tax=Dorcoceras hygrometricum TaxID=472368 RepID=A0A2Z7BUL6_9LAMI|nr:nuclear matrix constituent protein 1-like protein-like [Dorcoceras hygrometricum]